MPAHHIFPQNVVISLLFSSTVTCTRLMWFAVALALTMWMADLLFAASKLRRSLLPSSQQITQCIAIVLGYPPLIWKSVQLPRLAYL